MPVQVCRTALERTMIGGFDRLVVTVQPAFRIAAEAIGTKISGGNLIRDLAGNQTDTRPAVEITVGPAFGMGRDSGRSAFFVTILMAPVNDDEPYATPAGPESISIRSISVISTGRSTALCPVCGSQIFMPSR